MGLDGGTIITRSDVLRGSSWNVANRDSERRSTRGGQVDESYLPSKEEANAKDVFEAKWSCCALTGEPLQHDIVACALGRLYNRESLVQYLLSKNGVFVNEEAEWRYKNQLLSGIDLSHIKSLKDVFAVNLSNLSIKSDRSSSQAGKSDRPPSMASGSKRSRPSIESEFNLDRPITVKDWICPITGQNPGINAIFVMIKSCGHCFSSKSLKELNSSSCPSCNEFYCREKDVLPINGSNKQIAELRLKLKKQMKERKVKEKNKRLKSLQEN